MLDEYKDKRLKYVELPTAFRAKASKIDVDCKISMRRCEELAKIIARERPKTPAEFERHQATEAFINATATANEDTLGLLRYLHGFLTEVMADAKHLIEGAILRDKLRDQSDTIEILMEQTRTIRIIQDERNNRRSNQGNP